MAEQNRLHCGTVLRVKFDKGSKWLMPRAALLSLCEPLVPVLLADYCLACLQAQALLLELQSSLMRRSELRDAQRAKIMDALAVADKCLVDGADEFLQLLSVSSRVQQALAVAC